MRFVLLVALDIRLSAVAAEIHRFVALALFRKGSHGEIPDPPFLHFAVALAPFEKGGHGGFAVDSALIDQNQEQIPRHRCAMPAPFCKGGYKNKRATALAVDLEYKISIAGLEFRLFAVAFAPFEKGGHGGFALDSALLEQDQEQIPRHRFAMPAPFCKRGYESKAGLASSVRPPCRAARPAGCAERSHPR